MKRVFSVGILAIVFAVLLAAQSQVLPVVLNSEVVNGITSSSVVIDNRSPLLQSTQHTFCATGTGSWSAQIQYSDTAATGPWTNFAGTLSSVSNTSTDCAGIGKGYHAFIRFLISGTTTVGYAGTKNINFPLGGGGGGGGGVSSVTGTSPITSTGGTTPVIACTTCATGGTFTSGQLIIGGGSQALGLGDLSGDASTSGSTAVTVLKVHGVAYPASPSTNTIPVVTGSNTITYEALPNAALANSQVTINTTSPLAGGGAVVLGSALTLNCSTCTLNPSAATLNQLMIGGGGQQVAALGSAGTSITVLHGGTPPVFGSVVNADIAAATIDLTAKVANILPGANGGTGNGFFAVAGPNTSLKTFTFPNANANVLTDANCVTVSQGGNGSCASLSGVLLGNGISAFTAVALPGNAALFLNGAGGFTGPSVGGGTDAWSGIPLTFASNVTQYAPYSGGGVTSTTETNVSTKASGTATISKLHVSIDVALGASATLAVTLEDGTATPSALTCTTAGGGTTCDDVTHSVNVADLDLLSWKLVSSGSVTAGVPNIRITYAVGTSQVGVTTVSFTGGLISIANPSTTPAFTVAGTSGGIPYFASSSTWASSAALVANLPVFGGGAGVAPFTGTRTGNTTQVATWTGATTAGRCVDTDASGNLKITALDCGAGGSSVLVPGFVQMTVNRGNTIGSLAYPNNVVSGNLLAIGLGWFGGANTNSSISDTLGSSFTRVVQATGSANDNCAIFVGSAASSGSDTVTVTLPAGAGFNGVYIAEFTNTTTTTDGTFTGALATTNAVTTTVDGDLILNATDGNASNVTTYSSWGNLVGQYFTAASGTDSGGFYWYVQPKAGKVQTYVPNSSSIVEACSVALNHA